MASTGNEAGFALKVNPGYKITGLTAQMSGNSNSLTLSDIKIDGVAYTGSYTKEIPSNDSYVTITLSDIEATDYINFVKGSGVATQGYVYITVTYEPAHTGVKNVFIGTSGAADEYGVVTTVSAEDFEKMASLPAAWSNGGYNSVSIGTVTEVAPPAVDGTASSMPTYVSGNTMQRHQRQGQNTGLIYASYTLESAVNTGKLVFNSDFCATSYLSNAIYFRFVDADGNPVLTLNNNATNSSATYFQYAIGTGSATNTTAKSKWRTYNSFRITNLIMDFASGAVTFTLDYINDSGVRKQLSISCNIGTGKNVKSIQVGRNCVSSTDIYTHMDNISFYQTAPVYDYTINYTSGGNVIKTDVGRSFVGETINATASVTVSDITYTPTAQAVTSLTMTSSAASNVLNVPVEASVPYTINYVYNDGENDNVISSEDGYAIVGNTVDASITTSLWNSGNTTKYYVADNATTSFEVTSSGQIFTVALRLANTAAVATINAVCGETTHKTFTSAPGVEGENITVYYSKVVQSTVDSKFYTVNTNDYSKALTFGETTNVEYVLDETIVGFSEIGTGTTSSQSGGGNTTVNTKMAEATVDAGIYRAEIMVISKAGSGSNHRQEAVYVGGERTVQTSSNDNKLYELGFIVPNDNTEIFVRGIGSSDYSDNLDYVIIRKVGLSTELSAFMDLKASADALLTVENSNSTANSTLSAAISTQTSAVSNSTTADEVNTAKSSLLAAMNTYVAAASPTIGNKFDLTYLLTNPNLEGITDWGDAAAQGWFTDIPRTGVGQYNNFAARTNLNSSKNGIERFTSDAYTTANTYALYQKVTLPAGNYSFDANALANNASTIVMAAGSTEGDAVTASDFTSYSVDFTQASEGETKVGLKISSEGTNECNWMAITELKLYKEAESQVPASVSAAGYATFSSAYALDFTENTDVTAYVATGVEVGKVTMTSVEKVPANTGLLLKSNSGAAVQTTSIPVIAETVAAPETNYLKPGTGAAVAASTEGTYHYIFAKQGGYVGFFNLASAETVDVGKAYLETTTDIKPTTPGARVAIVFGDDETTGIQELKDSRLEVLKAGDCYNLKGQRVSQPTKGLYIVNGKKVIMK